LLVVEPLGPFFDAIVIVALSRPDAADVCGTASTQPLFDHRLALASSTWHGDAECFAGSRK
jgi:hypothetical protein